MSPLEATGAALGLANQWLTVRQNILCWPIGIASVFVYAFVFYDARLYSDMLLQGIYVVLQSYGWWHWTQLRYRLRDGDPNALARRLVPVTRLAPRGWAIVLAIAVLGTLALGGTMARYTQADFPYLDAFTTTLSVTAQWLQARKVLESWLVFITANALFLTIYWSKGLYLTMGLFMVLTVMAIIGFIKWRQSYRMS